MAKLEGRFWKSKRQLLVIAETPEERELIDAVLGNKLPIHVEGERVSDDSFNPYIRLSKKGN